MIFINTFLLFLTLLNSAPSEPNLYDECIQPYNMDLRIRACTQIIDRTGIGQNYLGAAYNSRGQARRAFGEIDRANADFKSAIAVLDEFTQLYPEDSTAYLERGISYRNLSQLDRAIANYDEAIRLSPKFALAFNNRCWARAVSNSELEKARTDCDVALKLEGNDPNTLDTRGLVGLKQGKYAEAWADYDAALRAIPSAAGYRYGRGIAALRLGRIEEGKADIQEALRIDVNIGKVFLDYGVSQ